jgi:membrane-associated phospholipid phosphatase
MDSIFTPSYPSGHALTARFFYRYFSDIDPINEKEYFKLMTNISLSRILAGVHYKSDCEAGILFGDVLYDKLKKIIF